MAITGCPREKWKDFSSFERLIHPEDRKEYLKGFTYLSYGKPFHFVYRVVRQDGSLRWLEEYATPVNDATGGRQAVSVLVDITDIRADESRKEFDPVTGLFNQTTFMKELERCLARSAERGQAVTLLFIDIAHFRQINESLGWAVGDELLKLFGQRLVSSLQSGALVARYGNDLFAALITDRDREQSEQSAQTVLDQLNQPFFVDSLELHITGSIGIAVAQKGELSADQLLSGAERALQAAKEKGKNGYAIFDPSPAESPANPILLAGGLRKAIELEEFRIFFQPRVDGGTGRIKGAEALLRWEHPILGFVPPDEFIPIAEETGVINDISNWLLKRVAKYLSAWKREGIPLVPISINLPPEQFFSKKWMADFVKDLLAGGLDPNLIELEITERTLIRHEETVLSAFRRIQNVGMKIALDDFGTGFSSLSNLREFPIHTVKIDKSFIAQIGKSEDDEAIIKALVYMGKALKKTIVAEGVETNEQLQFLNQLAVDEIQGYYFSRPVPEEEFRVLLSKKVLAAVKKEEEKMIRERRQFFRITPMFPMAGELSIVSIQGKPVDVGTRKVLIENIGPGGLKLLSDIRLPVRQDVILKIKTKILENDLTFLGHLVWKKDESIPFVYGMKFHMKESARDELVKFFNMFAVRLKDNPTLSGCDFVREEPLLFLKRAN